MYKIAVLQQRKNRDSNFELARIVAMLMIVIGHFVVHGIWEGEFCSRVDFQRPCYCIFENLIYSFCVCGVNIFVLISGYHRINLKLKSLLSLWFLCAFYGIIAAIVNNYAALSLLPSIVKALFISKSQWFFAAYMWLLLLSPILNAGLDSLPITTLRLSIVVLFILNCFSGWVLDNANANGYNVLHLVFIYSIGVWISKEQFFKEIRRQTYSLFFVLFSILLCFFSVVSLFFLSTSNFPVYYYNNPLVVLASIALFCYFSKLQLQSRIINMIASTVVAALFIQDFIVSEWIYTSINEAYAAGIFRFLLSSIIFGVGIFVSAFCIEIIRQVIFQPFNERIVSLCDKIGFGIFRL